MSGVRTQFLRGSSHYTTQTPSPPIKVRKKKLKGHFWDPSNELLNRTWSAYRYCITSCCILTLNRAVNRRFLWTEHTCVNNGSSHMVDRKSWVLWNDICRFPPEGLNLLESRWIWCQTQLTVTESAPLDWQPTGLQVKFLLGWEAEEEQREALKITQRSMVTRRKSYRSI